MAAYTNCITRLIQAAGRQLTDDEVRNIFERLHKAALDVKSGRTALADVELPVKGFKKPITAGLIFEEAARRAAADMEAEAQLAERQAYLQVTRLAARAGEVDRLVADGIKPLDAVEKTIVRDYSGRVTVESLEQRVAGYRAYFGRKLLDTWNALGDDWLGFFQDRGKLLNLVRELRGENTGDALAKQGAKAFHNVAEEARQTFNAGGGDIGRLDDWGMPQHHSQEKVAAAGRDAWVDQVLPLLDRARYVDELGQVWSEPELRAFLGKAWDTIATDGHANREPGAFRGVGKRANRHAESRQIHFQNADAVIGYWQAFGERTAVEILMSHVDTMARDIAFIEHFGPNPNVTYQSLRDMALKNAVTAEPRRTTSLEGRAQKLDELWNYAAGRTKPSANLKVSGLADGIANLNVAGKLGGAAIASFFGDKPMMEAVSHLNNLPVMQRWRTELSLLNPANTADRRLLQRQGLMLDSVRSGLNRYYEGLGSTGWTGKTANAVMRVTGMQAINDIRKGAFGLSLMDAIGGELRQGRDFGDLADSDVRALRNYGITAADWKVWKLAPLDDLGRGNDAVLTPEAVSRISDEQLRAAGFADPAAVRRDATVKLLGTINTESEFAVVTPGWRERAQFYGDLQRGTVKGEIARSILQFKSFPWAYLQRAMDAVANADGSVSKASMIAFLITANSLAGAMILQTREVLTGKDPRKMIGDDWHKFWGAAFLQGGALGIYGDFLYSVNQTRYGSGPLEALAGPTVGPLLELGIVQPLTAAKNAIDGKETHLGAQTLADLKGFVPGGNIWYAKAALEHLIWQQVMESMSPGYLGNMRRRTAKEYGQDWWWSPGEPLPDRAPNISASVER